MKRALISAALGLLPIALASVVDAWGLGDRFVGALLNQTSILALTFLAEALVPGSGSTVMAVLEAWLNAD